MKIQRHEGGHATREHLLRAPRLADPDNNKLEQRLCVYIQDMCDFPQPPRAECDRSLLTRVLNVRVADPAVTNVRSGLVLARPLLVRHRVFALVLLELALDHLGRDRLDRFASLSTFEERRRIARARVADVCTGLSRCGGRGVRARGSRRRERFRFAR